MPVVSKIFGPPFISCGHSRLTSSATSGKNKQKTWTENIMQHVQAHAMQLQLVLLMSQLIAEAAHRRSCCDSSSFMRRTSSIEWKKACLGHTDAHHRLLLPGNEGRHEAGCSRCKGSACGCYRAKRTEDVDRYLWEAKEICNGSPSGKCGFHQEQIGCPILSFA